MLNEYKSCRNPTLLSTVFNTLADKLKVQQAPNPKQQKDIYDFLVDKCINEEDANICISAAISLTLQKYTSDEEIMISLMSAMPYAKNTNAIVKAMSILCLRSEVDYTIQSNQHPLIKVIWHNPMSLEYILHMIYSTERTMLKKFETILLYVIIGHNYKIPEKLFSQLWTFICDSDSEFDQLRAVSCGALFQLTGKNCIDRTLNLIQTEITRDRTAGSLCYDRITNILIAILIEALKKNLEPFHILMTLKQVSSYSHILQYSSPALIIIQLSEIALNLHSFYVNDLILIFLKIVKSTTVHKSITKIFVETILKWKLFPLLGETGIKIDYNYYEGPKNELDLTDQLEDDLLTNRQYCTAFQIHELLDLSDDSLIPVLINFDNLSIDFLKEFVILFFGILANNRKPAITIKAIDLLTKLCDTYKEWTSTFLAIILSKLSEHLDPTVRYKLLKTLPRMGKRKENLRHIIGTLKLISKSKDVHMKSTSLTLMYDLWSVDNSCYKILQELLFEDHPNNEEFTITKAHILKELCKKKPELYFSELLPLLSKILNQSNMSSSLPIIFALEGLSHLVANDFIHADTIWSSIKPRFANETNVQILQSYFKWISNLNQLDSEDEKIQKTLIDAVAVLWDATLKYDDVYVIKAAFDAMKCFSLEILSISMPPKFKQGHNMDNFSLLPSKCWMSILLQLPNRGNVALTAAADFLISLVRREIAEYRPHIYMLGGDTSQGKREPMGFKTLAYHSILIDISAYVRTHSTPEKLSKIDSVMVQCLRILAGDSTDASNTKENVQNGDCERQSSCYSKPLPPHSWSFLQELIHVPEYKPHVLEVACHQVGVSGSARRLIENYLMGLQDIDEDDACLLSRVNLFYLCNSIQPSILQPFLANGIAYSCENGVSDLEQLINNYICFMNDNNSSESNKYSLINIAKDYLPELIADDKITEIILPLIALVSDVVLEEYWSMDDGTITDLETIQNRLKMYAMIKCQRIINSSENGETDNAFKHLDVILDSQIFLDFDSRENFLCDYLLQIYPKVSMDQIIKFLFNIIGKTELLLADDGEITSFILQYCEIFIKTILYLSQYRDHICFRNVDGCIHFGHGLQTLAQKENTDWADLIPQILEWIWYMTKKLDDVKYNKQTNSKGEYCIRTLRCGLYTLRGEPCFIAKWPKYLETAYDMITSDWIDYSD